MSQHAISEPPIATLLGIATKAKKYAPMQLQDAGELTLDKGLLGDWRGKQKKRQVTLMTQAAWDIACEQLGTPLLWTERRANLLVDDLPLFETTGARLYVGDAVLEVTCETDPCERMDQVQPGLFAALRPEWRGGVCCRVVQPGAIQVGMEVKLVT